MTVNGFQFEYVGQILPVKNNESVVSFMPQGRYMNGGNLKRHDYGDGPFCKFTIPGNLQTSGVYLILVDEVVLYVGETRKFSARFNNGYGNISPRNCFIGGQMTNCRVNNLIYVAAIDGQSISIYFHKTPDYKTVESKLRVDLKPPWNRI